MLFQKQIIDAYKAMMYTRCDDTDTVFYYSEDDFPGLKRASFTFPSSLGHRLYGNFYHYDSPIENRLIVFDHGFGGGHRAYMKEIEMLCRHGYLVFSYDHTGCMTSHGDTPNGLSQSLRDLDDCMRVLKKHPGLSGYTFSVVGHSWGGFSTLNIPALHPEITHTVVLSGFASVRDMVDSFFEGPLKGCREAVWALEQQANPVFSHYHGIQTLSMVDTKALLIYSMDDPLCKRVHYDILKSGLDGRENVTFLAVEGRGHNPNYTQNAVKLLGEFSTARGKLLKKKKRTDAENAAFVSSFDWEAMTEQDHMVWEEIFAHLDENE